MYTQILNNIGKKLYNTNKFRGFKRYIVFRTRCQLHKSYLRDILDFFAENELRKAMLQGTPSFVEQVTRSFFYKNSTWAERVALVKEHVLWTEKTFIKDFLENIYIKPQKIRIWEDSYLEKPISMELLFHAGQRKEGCLSLMLIYEGQALYQIMFWIGNDKQDSSVPAIYIGALQGTPNGSEIIKGLTKAFFGYRTKNMIFYGIRNFAACIGAKNIYAVANEGYYAMNHIRRDRKLKTSLDDFWQECEGKQCEDKRFYVMPVEEYRKSMEELKPSKRAQHRRRFEKLDQIVASVAEILAKYKK